MSTKLSQLRVLGRAVYRHHPLFRFTTRSGSSGSACCGVVVALAPFLLLAAISLGSDAQQLEVEEVTSNARGVRGVKASA